MNITKRIKYGRRGFFYRMGALGIVLMGCKDETKDIPDEDTKPDDDHTPKEYLPDWEEGFLDIHHIATGKGDAAFIICPDGTTMLIDAGEVGNGNGTISLIPAENNGKMPGELIADYIRHFSAPLRQERPSLDYVWLTHFHADHIGSLRSGAPTVNGYLLSGITEVGEHVDMKKIIDRGWPDYNFPSRSAIVGESANFLGDYLKFIEYQQHHRQTTIEGFAAGSGTQFVLQRHPEAYPGFKMQNLYVNGKVWTGQGNTVKTLFDASAQPDENMCSGALKLSYGPFSYFAGGDISGANHSQYPSKQRDVETPVSEVTGRVSVLNANHHAWVEATNATFLAALKPRAVVIPVCHQAHPHPATLSRITDTNVYPGERSVFATGFSEGSKKLLGPAAEVFQPVGHVVVRVYNGGAKYRIFVLNAESLSYEIIKESDEITA